MLLDSRTIWVMWFSGKCESIFSLLGSEVNGKCTYRLRICMSSILVVFSIDLTSTRVFGVIGEFASLSGLKFKTAFMIRLDVEGLVRTRMDRAFRVPSTTSASLETGIARSEGNSWIHGRLHSHAILLEYAEYPVQETSGLCFELSRVEEGMTCWHHAQGYLKPIALTKVSSRSRRMSHIKRDLTLSMLTAVVCASTTRWANLIQHNLTAGAAVSQRRSIFCLMVIMSSQGDRS